MSDKESFAEMFEREAPQAPRARSLAVGDEVEGEVVLAGADAVFIQLDEKRQAYFSKIDLPRADEVVVGQRLRGFIVDIDSSGEIRVGLGFGKDAGAAQLALAHEQGIPVEGKVVGVNKGGLDVEVAGVRAFCPASQIEDRFVEDTSSYVGQTLKFIVTAVEDRGAVLSRRRILAAEKAEAREALLSHLAVGAILTGRVTQIRDFGAFVDLGGIDGLLPRAELSHDHVRPDDVVAVGDVVEVKVLSIEERDGKSRISLSLKALATDPWDGIAAIAPLGKVVAGQVSRLADFGAFVRLATGVEGLMHISELGAGVSHPDEVLEIGSQVLAVVKSIDQKRRRIALVPAEEGAEIGAAGLSAGPIVGSVVDATVDKVERFGVFVQITGVRGRIGRGLIPNAELGVERGVDVRKAFPAGKTVRAKVLETGEGRLRLSISAAIADVERAEFDGFKEAHGAPSSMGTLGDLLKKKLEGDG